MFEVKQHLTKESVLFFRVALIFGGITVAAGFIGVALGTEIARRYRKVNPRADPITCAFGLLTCTPFLFFALVLAEFNTTATWVSHSALGYWLGQPAVLWGTG